MLNRDVFQCSVLISFWRVRHLWHKNLIEKCSELDVCAAMARQLGGAVSNISRGSGNLDSFKSFLEEFVDWPDFLDYFTAVWIPRIGLSLSTLLISYRNIYLFISMENICCNLTCIYLHQVKIHIYLSNNMRIFLIQSQLFPHEGIHLRNCP